jgi:hypothetical protein
MNAPKFTKGPWLVGDPNNVSGLAGIGIHADDYVIADMCLDVPSIFNQRANARLMAAAPELFNALSVLIDAADARGIPVDAARVALAKAVMP